LQEKVLRRRPAEKAKHRFENKKHELLVGCTYYKHILNIDEEQKVGSLPENNLLFHSQAIDNCALSMITVRYRKGRRVSRESVGETSAQQLPPVDDIVITLLTQIVLRRLSMLVQSVFYHW
jgi:hypothetical protein